MDRLVRPMAALLVVLGLLAGGALLYAQQSHQPAAVSAVPMAQASGSFADPAFQQVWERTDKPVQDGVVTDRSWTWGPTGFYSLYEPYVEAFNGQHLVQYFDKSRMEINDPNGDRNSQWFVTNGLLVTEMMSGKIAAGNNVYTQTLAAQIPVAGDASSSVNAPTYASLAKVASLTGNNRALDRTGQIVDQALDKDASIISSAKIKEYAGNVVYAVYDSTLGHNIPNVFWTFMNQSGLVYENGQYVTGKIFDWVFAMGYPITEPYWISISVGGQERWVLMQAFQRRVLTYSPQNSPSFQVEMGNVGRSYFDWRYNQQGQVLPTATPVPPAPPTGTPAPTAVAVISLDPGTGNINTTIHVAGTGFPAYGGINVGVEVPGTGDQRGLTTAAADANGNFTSYISMPDEYAQEADVTVYAFANGGSVKATAVYVIAHNPTLALVPPETTNVGVIEVSGADFPANSEITLSAKDTGSGVVAATAKVTTDGAGNFHATYTLQGRAAVGVQYAITAEGPNNIQVQSPVNLKIVQQPAVVVQPNHGPVGTNVIFSGSRWQPNRMLQITLEGENGQTLLPLPPVVTDGAGNFATQVFISQDYAGQSQVQLWATDNTSRITAKAPYTIDKIPPTPTPIPIVPTVPPSPTRPAPPSPTAPPLPTAIPTLPPTQVIPPTPTQVAGPAVLTVSPNPIVNGQMLTIAGQAFPAGSTVTISFVLGTDLPPTPTGAGTPMGTFLATAQANSQGSFSIQFQLNAPLQGGGTVTIIARTATGVMATAPLTVTP